METENQVKKKPLEVKIMRDTLAIFAIGISFLSVLLSLCAIVRPFDKEEIIVTSGDELTLFRGTVGGTLVAAQEISLRNVGKKAGDIASIEGLIVSQKKNREDNPIFKKYFYEIRYSESKDYPFAKDYPFFHWVVFPNEWHSYELSLNQEKPRDYDYSHKEFDNFDVGDYEYLLILKNDEKTHICVKHYQFSVNKSEMDALVNEVPVYFSLIPLQNKKRTNELLKIMGALKIVNPKSNKIGRSIQELEKVDKYDDE